MATIYIDPSSATNGAGTEGDPRNTWIGVTWTAGNTYLQKRGTTFSGTAGRITISTTGTAGSPITLGAYGEGARPILDGGGTRDFAIFATNHQYINVSDFEIRNYTRAGPYFGTSTTADIDRYITLTRLWVHNIGGTNPAAGAWFWGRYVSFVDCVFEDLDEDGIWGDGRFATFDRTIIRRVSTNGAGLGDCLQFGGIHASGLTIRNCYFDHLLNNDKQIIVLAGSSETAATFLIEDNTFIGYSSGAGAITMDVQTDSSGGAVFQRNTLVSNRGLRWANADTNGRGIVCRHNLFMAIGDGVSDGGAQAFMSVSGKAHNNTFIDFYRGADVGIGEVKNNVFLNLGDFDYNASTGANIVTNAWWNVGRHAPSQEGTGNLNKDPMIGPDGRPLAGSPLLGAGTELGLARDLEGKQRPNPPSIGAYDAATLRPVLTSDPA